MQMLLFYILSITAIAFIIVVVIAVVGFILEVLPFLIITAILLYVFNRVLWNHFKAFIISAAEKLKENK